MKIEHLAFWVDNLEEMKVFYTTYFNAAAGEIYHNPVKQFHSYFLSFADGAARIELMTRPDIATMEHNRGFIKGVAHFAMTVGDKEAVNALTERLRADGFTITGEPRTTGDGYYESAVLDPEGNYVEICAE